MAAPKRPRFGSLQFYPRKRVEKYIPSVNWNVMTNKEEGLLGVITYKVGMGTALVKDVTDKSMTTGKKVFLPVTILEVPEMKIFSVRFYKHGMPIKEVVVSHDKELRRVMKLPKEVKSLEGNIPESYDDVKVLVYSLAHKTSVKKTPDMAELAINASDKISYIKSLIGKEISYKNFVKTELVDTRGLTTGRGLSGPVKRFGISLKGHKSEKGVRRPGSLAPWHPARVTFHTPHAGQLGLFTRVHYNIKIVNSASIQEKNINPGTGFKNYGKINTNYILLQGSVQGPPKRQILLTPSFRPTKLTAKKKFEFQELII